MPSNRILTSKALITIAGIGMLLSILLLGGTISFLYTPSPDTPAQTTTLSGVDTTQQDNKVSTISNISYIILLVALSIITAIATIAALLAIYRKGQPDPASHEPAELAHPATENINTMIRELYKNRLLAKTAIHTIHDAVIVIDEQGFIEQANSFGAKLLGIEMPIEGKIKIDSVLKIKKIKYHTEQRFDPISEAFAQRKTVIAEGENYVLCRGHEQTAIEITVAPILTEANVVFGGVIVLKDISVMRALTTELAHQALHDGLTGLLNRREFENRLEQTIAETRRYKEEQAWLCYLDLDQFKIINDTCGHIAGDELLKQIAYRLIEVVREVDHVARMGGDEFTIILKRCTQDMAYNIMERVRKKIHEMRFCWDNKCFTIGASIGIVKIDAQAGTIHDILKAADSACYVAKDEGRNYVYMSTEQDQRGNERQGEMEWVHRIYDAIENEKFILYFQEIRALQSPHTSLHGEMLIRMIDNNGGIIPPFSFIPAAERYGLMAEVDKYIVKLAIESLNRYYSNEKVAQGLFSINLSAQSLSDDGFLKFVTTQLANSHVLPNNLCFEITETAAISNLTRATHFINTLKEKGCYFALDDFGSGLSSFAYLKNLPVDYIKIDGGFVKDMLTDDLDHAMVNAVSEIGHVVGKATIAEFVETTDIQQALTGLGVDYGQGYGIARPEPLESLLSRINSMQQQDTAS